MEREIRWEKEVLVGPGRPCVSSRERGLCLQAVSGVSQGFSGKQGGSSVFQSYGPGGGVWADWAEARLKVARFLPPDGDGRPGGEGLSEFLSPRCHKNSYKLSITSHMPIALPAKFSH